MIKRRGTSGRRDPSTPRSQWHRDQEELPWTSHTGHSLLRPPEGWPSTRGDLAHYRATHPVVDRLDNPIPGSVTHEDKESSLGYAGVDLRHTAAAATITAAVDECNDRERDHPNHSSRSRHYRYARS